MIKRDEEVGRLHTWKSPGSILSSTFVSLCSASLLSLAPIVTESTIQGCKHCEEEIGRVRRTCRKE